MLSIMCANCPDLALTLLRQNIAETLLYLLTGSGEITSDEVLSFDLALIVLLYILRIEREVYIYNISG